jgi:cysteine desulfurase family protein
MIYLDNAATSFPKPPEVALSMTSFMDTICASPGRSGHRLSVEAARVVYNAREKAAGLFGAPDPLRVIFCENATAALNLAITGLLKPGEHVITSSMEHNSVMRPLRCLEAEGVEVSVAQCSPQGFLDPCDIKKLVRNNTVLIAINHASNVTGSIQPAAEIGRIARGLGIFLLVDAAQSAGCIPIDMEADCIDLLAFTGHKNLYGPQGTGGLIIGTRLDASKLAPLMTGGTGSRSEHEYQPDFLPDKYESGTPNTVGIAGLGAGLGFIVKAGIGLIRAHEMKLTERLINGLRGIDGVCVYGGGEAETQTATISFNIQGVSPSEASLCLDEEYDIMCRPGLHCSPSAHKTLETFPDGTIRFSPGYFNTLDEIDSAVDAVRNIAHGART